MKLQTFSLELVFLVLLLFYLIHGYIYNICLESHSMQILHQNIE